MGQRGAARRRGRNMGGVARILAVGIAIGSARYKVVSAESILPAAAEMVAETAAVAAAVGGEGFAQCGLRVTMWGDANDCGKVARGSRGVECDGLFRPEEADRVQALLGNERREALIVMEAGTSSWRQTFDFDCGDARGTLVVAIHDKLSRVMAQCTAEDLSAIDSRRSMRCKGVHGAQFSFAVEHANMAPVLVEPMRHLQESPTPSTTPDDDETETAEPVAEDTDPPTSEPVTATDPPEPATPEPTPAPETPATPEPTVPEDPPTAPPVVPPTAPPISPTPGPVEDTEPPVVSPTEAPVDPPTTEPTPTTDAPVTLVAPTEQPVTPVEPTPSPVEETTSAPEADPTAEPTDGTPTVAPTPSLPTPVPTELAPPPTSTPEVTLTPDLIGTQEPTQSVASPTALPTSSVITPAPVVAPSPPPVAPTSSPSSSPSTPPPSPLPPTSEPPATPTGTSSPSDGDDGDGDGAGGSGDDGGDRGGYDDDRGGGGGYGGYGDGLGEDGDETPDPSTPTPVEGRTDAPVEGRTDAPVEDPTDAPVEDPTDAPVEDPTDTPVEDPTDAPVEDPTDTPTPFESPTPAPSSGPPIANPPANPNPAMSNPEPTATPTVAGSTSRPSVAATPSPLDSSPPVEVVTPPPVESPPPVSGSSSTLQPSSPTPPTAPPSSPPSQSPSASASSAPSAETIAPTAGPDQPTPAPADAPSVAPDSPTDAPVETSPPTFGPDATLPPSSSELCTDECIQNPTSSDYTATYYDYRCQNLDSTEEPGCNIAVDVDSSLENCRGCIINRTEYEEENGVDSLDWPDCPCCVATALGMDPQTDECIEEAALSPTPAPTDVDDDLLVRDLRTSANDPDLMMVTFNSDTCEAFGIAVIAETTVMKVEKYSDENGDCNSSFDLLYGEECELKEYLWGYDDDSYFYEYTCEDSTTSERRRLTTVATAYDSTTILCNNGISFITLSNLPGDDEGLVYATPDAVEYSEVTESMTAQSGDPYCGEDLTSVTTVVLETGVNNVLDEPDVASTDGESVAYEIVIPVICAFLLLVICGCLCCYRHRKGKEGRADQMRRNLGYTPDMEAKGDGNFGPTNKHVAITRGGGGPQVAPDLQPKTNFTPQNYPAVNPRAPSEAPSSIIEDNIANNYRPKTAAKSWKKRKEHKDLTKPVPQQHVIGAGPTTEELKAEVGRSSGGSVGHSEPISEHSLSQLELANQNAAASQSNYGYTFEEVEEDDDDDDARSAATGMSGPSKYAPSGYAPSSHHGGVTHDLMSQYEPSVYEADSQYDPSLYGRESEYGDESSAYSYNDGGGSHRRGGYGGGGVGRSGRHMSGRVSVADTAAMSHLGSVMEMDDASAYAPSESYVSSYVSSEDDDGRLPRSAHPRPDQHQHQHQHQQVRNSTPPDGNSYSRHNVHRSGEQSGAGGRTGSSSHGGSSSRHSAARSGFEGNARDYDEDEVDSDYYDEDQAASAMDSGRGAPLTDLDGAQGGRRW